MKASQRVPKDPDPETATQFVLELDLENLTEDEINYLHKLRTMAQRQVTEAYIKRLK